ncbi:MAG: indolepyruvate ferredoxin oxidoreductase family protein [Candidatus Tectomicrobia bacterium]|uniref:Indolepyruvate ferredoxin oxidoreductase family protein n=1 Tax=Tectimicrobiota bacterium TaxID=2528274 RepID=A0A932GP78_UNCTE|nr:indolepyruvate ferredoxin oxidoreductase family protein [Candidatus Tectomicrobia bacterium]
MSGQETKNISLEDRYLREDGTVYLSGLQALVRLPMDQNRRDRRAGLRIGTFISGYPGSPLGGYDLALRQARPLLERYSIVHVPGANEELAASAISGTQMLDNYPHSRFDGVVALWYGKGPGVDRSGDALKHGNFAGTSRHGAVVLLSGEDHEAKSSTMPYQDDYAFLSAGVPIVYPASPAEFLELGLHAIALSRYSGCWVALKLVGPLADGGETVNVSPDRPPVVIPELQFGNRPFQKTTDFTFFPGTNIETERRIYYERHQAALAYARANGLNRVFLQSSRDRLGIIMSGKSFADTRQALLDMGVDDETLQRFGVRLLRVGLIYPLDADAIRDFALDLAEIIVIEEKRGFLEAQVKEALCGFPHPVRVVGKFDETGAPFFPIQGGLDSDLIAERLGPRLLQYPGSHPGILGRLSELRNVRSRQYDALPTRTPNYCSGCPHNLSTRLLAGQVAWGSPGCHSFASIIEQPHRHIVSMTQLGGEGLPWIGLAPFTDRPHIVQNVGDGSLFHSSYLNLRFCVAAGVNITFKVLYNGYVANTGAQDPVGGKPLPELTRLLELEGVRRIAVVTKSPKAYRNAGLASCARVYPLEQHEQALKDLEREPGVTVYIYDGMCANERRRRQKRGTLPVANKFVVIHPEVCENCGDCGALTNCMSLQKVETEFGEKTQVHASSCNQDYSCVAGDCPSFVTVLTKEGTGYRRPAPPVLEGGVVPEPERKVNPHRPYHVYSPGAGGTGVITINALLCYAALIEGKRVLSYDQTGAAQKWGPVLSSLIIAGDGQPLAANKVGIGKADLYLVFDPVAATNRANLDRCDPDRTTAVINTTLLLTGEMIRNVFLTPPTGAILETLARYTRSGQNVCAEARRLAEALFGDYLMTNIFLVGVAYQSGLLPLAAGSIEAAIHLNGVQVEQNVQAFRYGRLQVADPGRLRELVESPRPGFEEEKAGALSRLSAADARAYGSMLEPSSHLDGEARRMLAIRIAELIDYQDAKYAGDYLDFVLQVAKAERTWNPSSSKITHLVIRHLYKLMAYKDEYEVARLHLKPAFRNQTRSLFVEPRRLIYNFHPPLLRALGLKRKLALGPWFTPALRVLRALRRLRGTRWDLFGYAAVRREERRLIPWYRETMEAALAHLREDTYPLVVEIARLPDGIRGYETIKRTNAAAARSRAASLMEQLVESRVPAGAGSR